MTIRKFSVRAAVLLLAGMSMGLSGQMKTPPPKITSLVINDGAAETRSRDVLVRFSTTSGYFQWRYRSLYGSVVGAWSEWWRRPASWPAHARIADTPLPQRMCVEVQTVEGAVSNEACAPITLVAEVTVDLNASDIYNSSGGNAHTRKLSCAPFSTSALLIEPTPVVVRVGYDRGATPGAGVQNAGGTKCDYAVFEGLRLKPGWQFVRANYSFTQFGQGGGKTGYGFQQQPAAGGRDITFRVHVWAESLFTARFQLNSITVRGPSNQEAQSGGLVRILE